MNKKMQNKLLNIVKKNYNEIASKFSQTRQKLIWPELTNLAQDIKDNDNILDAGCGNGRLLEIFKNKKINYLGVDSSKGLISEAQKNWPNYNFQVGDILELDKLKQTNFDYVFCVAVLHHLPGQDLQVEALRQIKNKIKPDGKIILTVWNLWSQKKYRKLILKFALLKLIGKNKMDFGDVLFDWKNSRGEALSQRYYHAFTKPELRRIAKKAGLKIGDMYKDEKNYYLVLRDF